MVRCKRCTTPRVFTTSAAFQQPSATPSLPRLWPRPTCKRQLATSLNWSDGGGAHGWPLAANSDPFQDYKVHVLEMPAGDHPEDGVVRCLALVVLRRLTGLLLCVPRGYFNDEVRAAGLSAAMEDQIGQSTSLTLPAGSFQDVTIFGQRVVQPGSTVDVVLVDVSLDVGDHLKPFLAADPLAEGLVTFGSFDPLSVPMTEELVAATWRWVLDPGSGERIAFYPAQEEEEEAAPEFAPLPRRPKAKGAGPGTGGDAGPKGAQKKPRPTVATFSVLWRN